VQSCRVLTYKNEGESKALGTEGNGSLENAWLMPYSGDNYRYFSPLSYYVLHNAFIHHKLHNTLIEAFETCEINCPERKFRVMECANKHGGKMLIHRTHQTGLSVDLMTPMMKKGKPYTLTDHLGVWHYLLDYGNSGKWTKNIEVDFETLGRLILAIDDSAKKNGLKLSKVILKTDLKDEFYASESGKQVKARGIYLAMVLPKMVNNLHDDHIHLDFREY
jgi:penicillin-insensitive murein endopeptidase